MDNLQEIDGKLYATARAYIVDKPEDMPRGLSTEIDRSQHNSSYLWIAGRYVQAGSINKNGYYWSYDDIKRGEASIRYAPMNVLHKFDQPVGTFVETKIVHRENASAATETLPEIQALGVLWASNFPGVAEAAKAAHESKQLWFSMECKADTQECLQCHQVSPFMAVANETCEHLAESVTAGSRRFANPTFLGGALVFPPGKPAWADAEVTDVAQALIEEYAHRDEGADMDVERWEASMALVMAD
jgi:hypothetical protein